MSNCNVCGRRFTCGCQKAYDENGAAVCKSCKPVKQSSTNTLSRQLAQQKIMDLKSKY